MVADRRSQGLEQSPRQLWVCAVELDILAELREIETPKVWSSFG